MKLRRVGSLPGGELLRRLEARSVALPVDTTITDRHIGLLPPRAENPRTPLGAEPGDDMRAGVVVDAGCRLIEGDEIVGCEDRAHRELEAQ